MLIEQEIQRKISDFRELGIPDYIPRSGKIHTVSQMVSTVIGARRTGKSYRVMQQANELVKDGFIESLEQICYLDFDNPILSSMKSRELGLIQRTFLKMGPEFTLKTPLVFILDEIHKIPGWEEYVIDLSRNPFWQVLVTGSSSKLLRDDISTALRGKAIASTMYPLSFAEYIQFRQFKGSTHSTSGQAKIQQLFSDYLKWGGFPAIPQTNPYTREALLHEYFDTMILKDIIQRHNATKPAQCIQLYYYLLSMMGRPSTLKSAYEFLRQNGHATSRDTVRDYITWAKDAWLLFAVPIHSNSQKEQERNYRKIYSIDWALAIHNSSVWDGAYSRALENLVFIQLHRTYARVHYYLTRRKRQEIDFLVSDEHGTPCASIQVCMDISLPDTLKRELEPLLATARYFGTSKNLILTMSDSRQIVQDDITVDVIPVWQWCLSQHQG